MREMFERSCLKCGKKFKTFDSNKKFCTLSCEEEFSNSEKDRNLFNPRILYETCLGCGEPLKQKRTRGCPKKFCCEKCRWIYHSTIKRNKERGYPEKETMDIFKEIVKCLDKELYLKAWKLVNERFRQINEHRPQQ